MDPENILGIGRDSKRIKAQISRKALVQRTKRKERALREQRKQPIISKDGLQLQKRRATNGARRKERR